MGLKPCIADKYYLHYINLLPEVGPAALWKLSQYFEQFQTACKATTFQLEKSGLSEKLAKKIYVHCHKNNLDQPVTKAVEQQKQLLDRLGIGLCDFTEPNYPELLKQIAVPPPLLYFKGNLEMLNTQHCLAVVGTRQCTSYGQQVTEELVSALVKHNIIIVSGLAFGIDSIAHKQALQQGGATVAVLPGGINHNSVYPPAHYNLAKQIASSRTGCLISECPPNAKIYKGSFLARNRIVAGLCSAVLVTQCGMKSGAIMTARYARDENRTVYSVPGSIFNKQSAGTNSLIQQGAVLTTFSAEEILNDLGLHVNEKARPVDSSVKNFTNIEQLVLQYIHNGVVKKDELITLLQYENVSINQTLSTLLELEFRNFINLGSNQTYTLLKPYENS